MAVAANNFEELWCQEEEKENIIEDNIITVLCRNSFQRKQILEQVPILRSKLRTEYF